MSPRQTDIADMQCWVFRLLQKRSGMEPGACARMFRDHGVFDYIADSYGLLHLSSYDCAADDVERFLRRRGALPC